MSLEGKVEKVKKGGDFLMVFRMRLFRRILDELRLWEERCVFSRANKNGSNIQKKTSLVIRHQAGSDGMRNIYCC